MWRFAEIRQVPGIVRYWAIKRPDKVALIHGAATRTYADLDRRSNAIANRLIANGVGPGAHIGFIGKNAIEFFEVWFAAGKAGCAIASFNWRSSAEELVALIDDAKPPVVFVGDEFADVMRKVQGRCESRFEIVDFDPSGRDVGALTQWIEGVPDKDPRAPIAGRDISS